MLHLLLYFFRNEAKQNGGRSVEISIFMINANSPNVLSYGVLQTNETAENRYCGGLLSKIGQYKNPKNLSWIVPLIYNSFSIVV